MPCFQPIEAWRKVGAYDSNTGKWPLTFKRSEGYKETALFVPCGKCQGCRMDYSRSWAIRACHEAALHKQNCCVTLTYDDEHLPPDGELDKRAFQNWLKILRSRVGHFRYFGCGEYGDLGNRPHYHLLIFGYDFADKIMVTCHGGASQYTSELLSTLWPFGYSTVGLCNYKSAAYIARYVFKKQLNPKDETHKQPAYTMYSLKPGIGAGFIEKYKDDFLANFSCLWDGKEYKIPKFYESRLSEADLLALKRYRLSKTVIESPTRLSQRRLFFESKLNTLKRNFEHE